VTGYLCYAAKIREEYIHVPREDYCKKRAEVRRLRPGAARER
jgi:hypothetical protein